MPCLHRLANPKGNELVLNFSSSIVHVEGRTKPHKCRNPVVISPLFTGRYFKTYRYPVIRVTRKRFPSYSIFLSLVFSLILRSTSHLTSVIRLCFLCLAWLVRVWEVINPQGLLVVKTNDCWDLESLKAVLGNK